LERIENAPESIAWLAMIAEKMAMMKVGQNNGAAFFIHKHFFFSESQTSSPRRRKPVF
jgi:hypothetical protein